MASATIPSNLMTVERVEYYVLLHRAWMNIFLMHFCANYAIGDDTDKDPVREELQRMVYPSSSFIGVAMAIANAGSEVELINDIIKVAWIDSRETFFEQTTMLEPAKSILHEQTSEKGVFERDGLAIAKFYKDEETIHMTIKRFRKTFSFTEKQRENVEKLISIDFATYKKERLRNAFERGKYDAAKI